MVRWFIDRSPQAGTPSVNLRRLLPDATFVGGASWDVSGCTADPSGVGPGQAFVAVGTDGHERAAEAIGRGAAALVVERPLTGAGRPQAVVANARAAQARLAHALAGDPASRLDVIAVAGESQGDAAVVSLLLRSIFETDGRRFGAVDAEGWSDGLATLPVGPGYPGAGALASMLGAMASRLCAGAVVSLARPELEATSVGEGIGFASAIVLGGSASGSVADVRDARRRAYGRLVRRVRDGGAVIVDADDPASEILGAVNLDADRVSFGIEAEADVRAVVLSVDGDRSRFRIRAGGLDLPVSLRLGGLGSIRLALAAFAAAWAGGVEAATIVAGLEAVDVIPGRPIRVDEGQGFEVRVDAAGTPDALSRALADLRAAISGRVVCLIGAKAELDRDARRRLAEAAEAGADTLVFTADNPRGEDPRLILEEMLAGTRRPGAVRIETDRRGAIELALALARPGDAVLIAGKGRAAFQILADRVVPFDDRAVASRWLRTAPARRQSA